MRAPSVGERARLSSARGASARALVAQAVGDDYRRGRTLDELRERFAEHGYVKLPRLLSDDTLDVLRSEIGALESLERARDFVMAGPDTPRVLSVLGATQLLAGSPAAALLYVHHELVGVVARIAGTAIHACSHDEELMVCNFLLSEGSTHGWHLDDPPYALVIVLEAPVRGCGGELELITDWAGMCRRLGLDPDGPVDAAVAVARGEGLVTRVDHGAGDAYLLRADRCMHRVARLRAPGMRRVALNFAYEGAITPAYGDSASSLYGP